MTVVEKSAIYGQDRDNRNAERHNYGTGTDLEQHWIIYQYLLYFVHVYYFLKRSVNFNWSGFGISY